MDCFSRGTANGKMGKVSDHRRAIDDTGILDFLYW